MVTSLAESEGLVWFSFHRTVEGPAVVMNHPRSVPYQPLSNDNSQNHLHSYPLLKRGLPDNKIRHCSHANHKRKRNLRVGLSRHFARTDVLVGERTSDAPRAAASAPPHEAPSSRKVLLSGLEN